MPQCIQEIAKAVISPPLHSPADTTHYTDVLEVNSNESSSKRYLLSHVVHSNFIKLTGETPCVGFIQRKTHFILFIYLKTIFLSLFILRERERARGGEGQREGGGGSEAGSALSAQSLLRGSIS